MAPARTSAPTLVFGCDVDILGQQSGETLTAVFLALCVLGASVLLGLVIMLAREGRIQSKYLGALAVVCSIGLLGMLITDWPSEVLARFWADHSVVAGVLSTVLMLGIGFLVFEVRDVNAQEALDNSLTAAGFGGLVDYVVDVEVAMALVAAGSPPDHLWRRKRSKTDRPLRWLRYQPVAVSRDRPLVGPRPRIRGVVSTASGHCRGRRNLGGSSSSTSACAGCWRGFETGPPWSAGRVAE